MKYASKFDIGQHVFTIYETTAYRSVKCSTCEQTGSVTVNGEAFICPKCGGASKHKQNAGMKWFVGDIYNEGRVSKIQIEHTTGVHHRHGDPEIVVSYAVFRSLLKSGPAPTCSSVCSVHREENVFPSRAEATAECDQRNAGGNWEDEA